MPRKASCSNIQSDAPFYFARYNRKPFSRTIIIIMTHTLFLAVVTLCEGSSAIASNPRRKIAHRWSSYTFGQTSKENSSVSCRMIGKMPQKSLSQTRVSLNHSWTVSSGGWKNWFGVMAWKARQSECIPRPHSNSIVCTVCRLPTLSTFSRTIGKPIFPDINFCMVVLHPIFGWNKGIWNFISLELSRKKSWNMWVRYHYDSPDQDIRPSTLWTCNNNKRQWKIKSGTWRPEFHFPISKKKMKQWSPAKKTIV